MDDFQGLLARDFGFRPQGKAAPMAPPRNSPAANFSSFPSSVAFGLGSSASDFIRSSSSTRSKNNSIPVFDDHDGGGPPKYASSESTSAAPPASGPAFDYDIVFKDQKAAKSASIPVSDKPVYDEDIFDGMPGLKGSSASASAKYEDVFSSISTSPPKHKKQDSSPFDDLLGNFGKKVAEAKKTERAREEKDILDFNNLIPGFGRNSSPPINRSMPESNRSQKSSYDTGKTASNLMDDPFVVLESSSTPAVSSLGAFTDPLEEISKLRSSRSRKADHSSVPGGVLDDQDHLDSLGKSVPEIIQGGKDTSHSLSGRMNGVQSPVENSGSHWKNKAPVDEFMESHQFPFGTPSVSVGRSASPSIVNPSPNEASSKANTASSSDENFRASDDVWLTVSEIPLFTRPTSALPPSRPPPPRPTHPKRTESGSCPSPNVRKAVNGFSSFAKSTQYSDSPRSARAKSTHYSDSPRPARASERRSVASQIDELEDFASARMQSTAHEYPEDSSGEDLEANSVAAAATMKEAMEKAEAKFRHAREMREREYLKSARSREGFQSERDDPQEKERMEKQDRLDCERKQRQREEEEKEQRRLEKERREQEEKEREQRRFEKERMEREREMARQAVERATREARERAAAEARAKAQKASVEKAAAEARERAERAAVQQAQAEARERAAAEAREKSVKAAAEARERANAEARAKAERAAVEKAAAEARERAMAEARERAAAQARANQPKNDNDLDSFFSMGSRPSSAPRPRANSSDPVFDMQNQRRAPEPARTSSGASSTMRKASSTANMVDDLSSIFGAAASPSGVFQEFEGESEERRRARLERHQRTQERAAKALAEKNERDLQAQREQAERHRIAETLDFEIKRWAAGKEGNLRALLSTLQYVLWPECGWQPVSLTDLITAASVKKVYRKATLCIHPDKVQQKGANLQQKYIAEKVFDLLKEAWNKFNSEELF